MTPRAFGGGHAEKGRVEAFSDGVLAIVITLLVLEIKVPDVAAGDEAALLSALEHVAPKMVAWVVSFLFVLVFWVAHHTLFAAIARVDRGMLWLNGLFLLAISFTPFPTALAGEHPESRLAVALLALAFLLSAAAFATIRWYATYRAGLFARFEPESARRAMRRSLAAPLLYTCALALAFVARPFAMILIAMVPLLFVLAPRGPDDAPAA